MTDAANPHLISLDSMLSPEDQQGLDEVSGDLFGGPLLRCDTTLLDTSAAIAAKSAPDDGPDRSVRSDEGGGLRSPQIADNSFMSGIKGPETPLSTLINNSNQSPGRVPIPRSPGGRPQPVNNGPPPRKRGRPKSTRPTVPAAKNAPNLYSVLSRATEISIAAVSATPVLPSPGGSTSWSSSPASSPGLPSMAVGLSPTELFGGAAEGGVPIETAPADDGFSWMNEARGKRRKNQQQQQQQHGMFPGPVSPLLDVMNSNPALMVSLGMRPGEAPANLCIAQTIPPSPKLPLHRTSPLVKSMTLDGNDANPVMLPPPPPAPLLPPMTAPPIPESRQPQMSTALEDRTRVDPNDFCVQNLFDELLGTGEPNEYGDIGGF